jgi:hypothetical protein
MKEVKKSPAKKAAPKAPAAKKAPVAAKAPAKVATMKTTELSPEQRYKMIEETAYYIAERHGFNGDSQYFWSLAVQEVEQRLS